MAADDGESAEQRRGQVVGVATATGDLHSLESGKLSVDRVLVAGPSSGRDLAGHEAAIAEWLEEGGQLLAIGLGESEANAFLPFEVHTRIEEYIATFFEPQGAGSPVAGIGPADLHNRDPRELPLVTGGAVVLGNGVLARSEDVNLVFLQLAPWRFDPEQQNQARVYRRTSFALSRLLGNLGVAGSTPLLGRFRDPVTPGGAEKRWLDGLYLDRPEEWDDPYRFFRW